MAKNRYTLTNTVDLVGTLDYNQEEKLVVYVEAGKGNDVVVSEVPLEEVLQRCIGMQIALKLSNEEDKCDE
jgi:hypothetical protein